MTIFRRRRPSQASEKAKTEAAKRELERVRSQWPVVRQLAEALREHHDRNHFSESIANLYRGGR
jgi:hypothetical protein